MGREDVHFQHACLFVPVDLLITEERGAAKSSVTYILPSSTIAIDGPPELVAAAQALDAKLSQLVSSATVH